MIKPLQQTTTTTRRATFRSIFDFLKNFLAQNVQKRIGCKNKNDQILHCESPCARQHWFFVLPLEVKSLTFRKPPRQRRRYRLRREDHLTGETSFRSQKVAQYGLFALHDLEERSEGWVGTLGWNYLGGLGRRGAT